MPATHTCAETARPRALGVLVVDDEQPVREQMAQALRRRGLDVAQAGSAAEAARLVAGRGDIGVVITDIRMPEEDGLSLARRLSDADDALRPEIVFVTGHATVEDAASAVRIGAADFLRKPLRSVELASAVGAAMARAQARRQAAAPAPQPPDALTGLPGRAALVGRLLAPRQGTCGLVLLDLDRFSLMNEALGMRGGDSLLAETARSIAAAAGPGALVARFGEDEFAVLVEDAAAGALPALAEALRAAASREVRAEGTTLLLTASAGFADSPEGDGAACLHGAEMALLTARGRGGNSSAGVADAEAEGGLQRARLAAGLTAALDGTAGLSVAYQPLRRAKDLSVLGFEALARFEDPALGPVDPDDFLPVAERYGLTNQLGRRILQEAIATAAGWRAQGVAFGHVAVNVAARQLREPGFAATVAEMAAAAGLPPACLCLEITEGEALPPEALPALAALRAAGFGVAIDDFGVGHSSLARLRDLPATSVKFDRRFIERLPGVAADQALLLGMVRLASALGLATVAEGVETPEQLAALRSAGVEACQGYLLGRPMPATEVPGFLAEG